MVFVPDLKLNKLTENDKQLCWANHYCLTGWGLFFRLPLCGSNGRWVGGK